jgi:hypothetical protein
MESRTARSAFGLAPAVLALCLLGGAGAAGAFECENCREPTSEEIANAPGYVRESHGEDPDTVSISGGECELRITSDPIVRRENSWLVLRAAGEVFHCPSVSSSDKVSAETAAEDSTTWALANGVELGLSIGDQRALSASFKLKLESGETGGVRIVEVTRIEKTLTAAWCHRVQWWAYFEVGHFSCDADYVIERRYAWWTKNDDTDEKVHRKGNIWVVCDSGTARFQRRAPIAGFFDLTQRGCDDPECDGVAARDLGWFPPLPPYLTPPPPPENKPKPPPEAPAPDQPPAEPPPPEPAPAPAPAPEPEPDPAPDEPSYGEPPLGNGPWPEPFEDPPYDPPPTGDDPAPSTLP